MACLETGTSTSNTLGSEYQVFLSFRGPDTRRGFTNSLYHALVDAGIRVFIDDEELRPGERISGNLLQAIDDSKLYIPIFSKAYALSHWCLRELAKMVENTSKSKEDGNRKVILPIFYDVKPDDVKLKTALYSEAILNLEQKMEDQKKKFNSEDIETWRQALKEVDDTKGWELEKYSGYGKLIQAVVEAVVVRLETRQIPVTKDLVGMKDQIEAIQKLLDINSGGVRIIVIYGMGGIGKTTLAKIIFNQLCPHFGRNCCFLEDVREAADNKDLNKLQEKLLSDISCSRVAYKMGIDRIEQTIRNKKMLIVLDDVDKGNQIQNLIPVNSLCPGTRILVTTRDKSVLNIRGFDNKFEDYEMVGLSDEDALKLFSRHAFDDNSPPVDYYTLSKSIVSTADGLPLALEAIGSSLYRQKRDIWEERLEKLKKTPYKDVFAKLRISYDALDPDQQQIFLDIACFFVGGSKTDPMYMWKDCDFCPQDAIDVLVKRCMIKVLDSDRFGMHDQFRDLGREIAKKERTGLWDEVDIICELKKREIKESVQALRWLPRSDRTAITSEQIKRFPCMRLLSLHQVNCQGDFTGCLSELKWIDLSYNYYVDNACRNQRLEATNLLHLENAVVVNLSGLQFTDDVFKSLIEGARKSRVITIKYNDLIHGTPTFLEDSVLEKLTIHKSSVFSEIDCSIGKLSWLTDLSIEFCHELRKLPKRIGELQNLRHLSLHSCSGLIELPDSVSKLVSLTKLDVSRTRITRLPDSIGKLPSLSSVDVSFTPIEKVPSTMSELHQLRTLDLRACDGIQELPKLPISLTALVLISSSLLTVPNLSYLTNLGKLVLSNGSDSTAISDIIQTCDLQWIGRLSKLSKLWFCFSNVRAPTIELGSLSLLKELTLCGLDLPTFKQLPSNLIVLELYDTRGKQVHLDGLPPSEKETLFVSSSLRKSGENKVYEQHDVQLLDVLESSERLRIRDYKSSERLVCLPEELGCNELQAPELIDHWRGAFHFPSSLKMLKKFVLSGFPELRDIQFVSTLESLEEFSVDECSSLKSLGGLSNLKNLKDLSIIRCVSLQVVEGIEKLEYLYQLKIEECISMERNFYASLHITCSASFSQLDRAVHRPHDPSSISRSSSTIASNPSPLKMLTRFLLWGCPEVQDIQFVSTFESLKEFYVGECSSLKSLGGLSNLKNLGQLTIDQCPSLQVVEGIDELEFLRFLTIIGCISMERNFYASIHITCSASCSQLDRAVHRPHDPSSISRSSSTIASNDDPSPLKMLRGFLLRGCPEVQNIQFVSTFESLKIFCVRECSSLKSLGGLSNLKNLEWLTIEQCPSLQVVEGIDELESLCRLEIYRCRSMEMIFDASSSKIPDKCWIDINDCEKLLNISPCPRWESYREKILNGTKQASDSETETTDSETEIETGDPLQKTVRLLSIHRSALFLLLYLLSISALF